MSTTDQAFIRAYSRDQPEAGPPPHHLSHSAVRGRRFGPTLGDLYRGRTSSEQEAPAGAAARESASQTSTFVPPPHAEYEAGRVALVGSGRRGGRSPLHLHGAPGPGQTRPLSTVGGGDAAGVGPAPTTFEPVLEVDAVRWPRAVDDLVDRYAKSFYEAAGRIRDLTDLDRAEGVLLAVTGPDREAGRTTTLLALARTVVQRGRTVAVVDADFARPALARTLGLAVDEGWEQVLTGAMSLADVSIQSLQDGLSIVPLAAHSARHAELAARPTATDSLRQLLRQYDLVLVDTGPALGPDARLGALLGPLATATALVVRDCSHTPDEAIDQTLTRLAEAGVVPVGIVENFSPHESAV